MRHEIRNRKEHIVDLSASERIVIVGAGQAAAQACASLRQYGFAGDLALIGEEPELPYQRPPLSKAYMKGELAKERLYFKPMDWYRAQSVALKLETRVNAVDRSGRRVLLENEEMLSYDALILAMGSRPRTLPLAGAGLANVFDLRTLGDVEGVRPHMRAGCRLVIIGAGYIGLEAAAVARQLGLKVTVLEMADRVLARVTSPVMSAFYEAEHLRQGVDIRTSVRVTGLTGGSSVQSVVLDDGTEIPADVVLAGIGIVPNVELAEASGLGCSNGVLVDRDTRTQDERIFAVGDCACRPLVHYGRRGRLESVHNAIEQGKLAAAAIMGKPRPVEDCPWFWSDQYDLKLQIAGLSEGYDTLVVRGDPGERKFAVFYLKAGRLLAVDAVNSAPEFLASKKLIVSGASLAPDTLRDTTQSMKEIAAAAA
jgi:3-phenylpropionate/trans-cinnamate dioxygenase ferredoxin reductase subunit